MPSASPRLSRTSVSAVARSTGRPSWASLSSHSVRSCGRGGQAALEDASSVRSGCFARRRRRSKGLVVIRGSWGDIARPVAPLLDQFPHQTTNSPKNQAHSPGSSVTAAGSNQPRLSRSTCGYATPRGSATRRLGESSPGHLRLPTVTERAAMGLEDKAKNQAEIAKGKVKEGVGDATDDERMQAEGEADQASGNMKQAGEKVKDTFRE